jgi:hypothetical protein
VTRALLGIALIGALAGRAAADPTPLAALAPPPGDDVRRAVAIGPGGEVYEPDGAGAWTRTKRVGTADTIERVGRAGGDVVAWGDGVVYKLAPNGWSAVRLHQKDKAVMASGPRAVAAVKRQLYSLEKVKAGEPEKIAVAPNTVTAIGAGKSIVIATERGLARVEGTKVNPIAGAPKQVVRLVDDRWAITATGAFDLRAGKATPWPGSRPTATAAIDDNLVAVATVGGKLELWTVRAKLDREAIPLTPGTAVGVAVDRTGRVVIALADGRLLLRQRGSWSETAVKVSLPSTRPGSPPATVK